MAPDTTEYLANTEAALRHQLSFFSRSSKETARLMRLLEAVQILLEARTAGLTFH